MRGGKFIGGVAALALLAGPASAETLREALARAYATNPQLTGARANQRATDEGVPLARSQGLPQVTTQSSVIENVINPASRGFTQAPRQGSVQVQVSQSLFAGGAVRNNVRAADARVDAGRANLRSTEANVFTLVVAAYNDVIRDEAIVRLNQQNLRVLEVNLQASKDRFQVGDLTRTDVAQSEARLASAQAQLRNAEASLIRSRENYVATTGAPAATLDTPPALPNLPVDPNAAVGVAVANNPSLIAARRTSDAAGFDVRVARAGRLPTINAVGGGSYTSFLGSAQSVQGVVLQQDGGQAQVGVQMSLPLWQSGRPSAQIRRAQALEGAAIEQVTQVERGVVSDARSAFAAWQSALRVIQSSEVQVAANRLSLEGVRAENSVGTRTILDILNAEQELLNSQVQLVTARRDAYVAGFALLAAMGRAEARDLGLDGGALYDPTVNYNRVRNVVWDWKDDPAPVPIAPSTVNSPAQTPVVTRELDPSLQRSPNPYTPTQGLDAPNRQGGAPRTTQGVDTPRANPDS
ncbi:TolC family outer membrane protein [Sphingomonas hankookensis]|uniref:TolC family outer membrane protein n=1 Tax=Sphingomonas hankookensis TaxID=563996 RepID=UPI001F5A248B|nr:TolC family outer membrane protein [Sphingomonas hankookensis]